MTMKRRWFKMVVVALAAIMLLSVPLAVAAQTQATENGITSPADGATVSGVIEIRGYANDPNFSKWQLDLLPSGEADQAAFLAVGLNSGVFTHTLDTANLPAGEHALRLRVVRTDSNYNEYTSNFVIAE